MNCKYIGKTEAHNYREAYITYNTKEEKEFNKLFDILKDKGWNLECEEECACIKVFNKDEYEEFYLDYKKAKRNVKNG